MLAIAGMLFATSCQREELPVTSVDGNYVDARFSVDVPMGIATKADPTIGTGVTVDKVKCVVYDAKGTQMTELDQTLNLTGKKATYSIRLVKGQAYRVVFFAYKDGANAYDVTDMKNIQVLGNQASNMESRDAFTGSVDVTADETMASVEKDVDLYRPFAQLNIGAYAEDIAAAKAAGVVVTNSQVVVSNVYTAFNAYADAVAGETSEMTFAMNGLPGEDLFVDVDGDGTAETYSYLALNYLLVGDMNTEKALTDVVFTWSTADGKTNDPVVTKFKNIPVQRNYRTNILGYILTNPAQFNVAIDADFMKPELNNPGHDYIVDVWDGSIPDTVEPTDPENPTTFEIRTGAELAWVAQQTIAGNTFEGKTVVLMNDIDLANQAWAPIGGNVTNHPSQTFAGTFDGNGYTIFNLNAVDNAPNHASAGLFGTITGEVKNVTVKNATVTSTHYAGAIVGYITEGVSITNCHVEDAVITSNFEVLADGSYDNGGKVGGIVGYANDVTVDGCTVKNTTINGYRDLGGITGLFSGSGEVKNCQVLENVVINVDMTHNYKNYTNQSEYDADHIVGDGTADDTNTGTATINFAIKTVTWNTMPETNPDGTLKLMTHEEAISNAPEGYRLATDAEANLMLSNGVATETETGWTIEFNGQTITLPYHFNDGYADHVYYWVAETTDCGPLGVCGLAITDVSSDYLETGCYPYFGDKQGVIYVKE